MERSGTFQRLTEFVLVGLQWEQCLIYLDDVIVFSDTFDAHLQRLDTVFTRLSGAGLKLKPGKCYLAQPAVKDLGHIVSSGGISPNPEKVEAISQFPTPTSAADLKSFLGLARYYRRFVPAFSKIAAPLFQAQAKDTKFQWTPDCQLAFQTLKDRLTAAPILGHPKFDVEFVLATDAYNSGLGAVLYQEHDGKERVIAYSSRALTKAERKHSTTEKALALVWGTSQFRPYFTIPSLFIWPPLYASYLSLPLKWLKSIKESRGRLAGGLSA